MLRNSGLFSIHFVRVVFVAAIFLFIAPQKMSSQALADSAFSNPVIAQHYSLSDLQQMDSTKIKTIIYYYTQSFTVQAINCNDCVAFDSTNFDVSLYEHYREFNTTYSREFDKYGFKLTLVPVNAMLYRIPINDRYYDNQNPENNPH